MAENRFFGLFQFVTQKYYQITRQPFVVDKDYFEGLNVKHFTREFSLKFNENLFVDQDKNSAQSLINEIFLNSYYFSTLSNELRVLKDWAKDFHKEYQNLKSILNIENIEINKNSKQYKQLELLKNKSQRLIEVADHNSDVINGDFELPLNFKSFDISNLEIPIGFNFDRLEEYPSEERFIESEPSDSFSVAIVFRRLSEIVTQLNSLNRSITNIEFTQTKFIHGNAGMGKSNFSVFIYTELLKQDKPAIIINGKSFNGDPDSFNKTFMDNLLVPHNYQLEEILQKLNNYGKKNNCRITIIIDGLNETSFAHNGFSKIWEKSLDNFIETLQKYPYLYLVATLRTSYFPRIWGKSEIPYNAIHLNGFSGGQLKNLIGRYFKEYKINTESLREADIFYFSTPLYLDLYCKMLNGGKMWEVEPLLGLDGFKRVFDNYLNSLAEKTHHKLNLITKDDVLDGIDRVSKEMIDELEGFVPMKTFYEKMEGKKVDRTDGTIGYEVLEEYLIYLDDNFNNRDVIRHTQQEVGGYLLAKKLVEDYGNVDEVVTSSFFDEGILGNSGKHHQLKDDILKFLIAESDSSSLLYTDYINQEVVKKFTTLNLLRTKSSEENKKLAALLLETKFTLDEVRTLIVDSSNSFYDPESSINFLFIKNVFLKLDNYNVDFAWTYYVYNNYSVFSEFLDYFLNYPEQLDGSNSDDVVIEIAIWLSETTIRDLRDKSTRFLLRYFQKFSDLILAKIVEYLGTERVYIQERLALVCYGVCLRLQNDQSFIDRSLGQIASSLYEFQFTAKPKNATYNYIVIDSFKHIIDLAILKGAFKLSDEGLERLSNFEFNKSDWCDVDQADIDAVPIAIHWSLDGNPDPLRGDFVHYTIPRLDNRDYNTRINHTANIYKEVLRLGYISEDNSLANREKSFYNGTSLLGSSVRVDRLGKKYSWMAYFNYAGHLLSQNRLGIWSSEDSDFEKHYKRLSDTEIDPSYDESLSFDERFITIDFFKDRSLEEGNWINVPNFDILNDLYKKDDYTLLAAFIDQKLDEKYETRSWIEAKSFFVNKKDVKDYIEKLENREFDWKYDLREGGTLDKTYFGELYWADTIPDLEKDNHNLPLESTKLITRAVNQRDIFNSDRFNFEDLNNEITETGHDNCSFQYEATLIDFLWETNSKELPGLRCDVPSPNIGKRLNLKVDSSSAQILDADLELCFKEYYSIYGLNSEKFHFFRTDLLEKYLQETDQFLMYQIKQHTYDTATKVHHKHFRGLQFKFSDLNRES